MILTKKAARKAGYVSESDLERKPIAPRRDAQPILVKGEQFFDRSECEELLSKTAAKRRHLAIPGTAQPVKTLHVIMRFRSVWYDVYRVSDCVPIPTRTGKTIPPVEIDLLKAIFVANKAAKRYRDSAQSNYRQGQHGFAGRARRKKEHLYRLKDRGVVEAYRQGRLSFVGYNGNIGLFRGEGYCLHSTSEGRLKDAVH